MNVGRDLWLQSQQDSDNYDAKQQSVSGGISIPIWGSNAGGNFSYSRDKMHSTYDSVQEQTGIYAGLGGFDITVGNHTQLDGAVISSTASADKNQLDTGTLGFSNIENKAEFKTEHQGVGISAGGDGGGKFIGNVAGGMIAAGDQISGVGGATNTGNQEGSPNLPGHMISDGKQDLPEWITDIDSPNGRHYFNNIKQKTTSKPLNTVIDSSVNVAADIAAIKNGQGVIKGNQITVNGRTYEREVSGTLAPISGDGFTTLNRGEFKSLGVYNQHGNTPRAEEILNNMGMSAEFRSKALEVWSKNQK
ncbi:hypothetical protein I2492_13415 [Budviciaceae bacterium CWB-B4]|uniref:Uncharacterized protein n=1 Tax=Limnobaculum xujianqingii TaxID=2738837 RepID=A0A9D7FUX9_9GAMM|nr:hypothetical protein [Limnobaculum xujianqingii]MBK5073789.1 hypothetical protein [Limnobaculum xujianqingii]MBK5177317.1 hypothetical protein [Limnobaculum xujianqingii]